MKKIAVCSLALTLVLISALCANAALHNLGNGLIYDDILDITWIQDANYAGTTMTWSEAMTWADNLVYQGYDDWRLPTTDTSCTGKNCTGSEMGHLYYNYGVTAATPGLFTNVRSYMYWSSTEDAADPANAWRFSFNYGTQDVSSKTLKRYAWAVRDGKATLPVIPEPISSALFIAGGATLGFRKLWQKINNTSN